jgi:septal ring factor EnvC (AmiA/AmiB activator)
LRFAFPPRRSSRENTGFDIAVKKRRLFMADTRKKLEADLKDIDKTLLNIDKEISRQQARREKIAARRSVVAKKLETAK